MCITPNRWSITWLGISMIHGDSMRDASDIKIHESQHQIVTRIVVIIPVI